MTRDTIYVYADEGVSAMSLKQTITTFTKLVGQQYTISTIDANAIKQGDWSTHAAAFILPGGADLPYVKKLHGLGDTTIQHYVKEGGVFIGICAGSYNASSAIIFDKGGPYQVIGKRELALFEGTTIGPILAPFDPNSEKGSRAATISTKFTPAPYATVYYNGGGFFKHAESFPNTTVIARYDNHKPAMIFIQYGQGKVLLSGVHFEYNPNLLNPNDPYSARIIPSLVASRQSRVTLRHQLLSMLGLMH